jgi:phenylacetate-CoA ligase
MEDILFQYPRDINKRLKELKTKPAFYWENLGKRYVDKLIRFTIDTTPAYRKFLKDNGLDYKKITGFKHLEKLPIMDKNSYLRQYPYQELYPNKNLKLKTISATSGSTGEPFYFIRGENLEKQYQYVAEIFMKNQWEIDKLNTLAVIGFGLGIWIGGLFTYTILENLIKNGYRLTILPIGTNKDLILKSIKRLYSFYDQVILMGYPPFIKDVGDEAKNYDIDFRKIKLRILNAAEGFSEEFRNYIAKNYDLENIINDNINIYGTVELGTMAHETAFANLIRRIAVEKDKVFKTIFPEANRIPTLAQYHPYIVYFEEKEGNIIASGHGESIPLIRYSFPDRGGVIKFDEMIKRLKSSGVDIFKEAEKWKIKDKILRLPFVYVYERKDFAVSLVGILIYPEYIRNALIKKDLQRYCTGKFSMLIEYDQKMNQKLVVHIELKKDVKSDKKIEDLAKKEIINSFLKNSTEYNHLYSTASEKYKKQLEPEIILHPYEDPTYFKPGIKQKWTIKK